MTGPRVPPRLAGLLELEAHPEGGWFRRTWTATATVEPPDGRGERSTATGIHYVLGAGEHSAWHRVSSDELWLWHRGAAVALRLGGAGDTPDETGRGLVLGPRIEDGHLVQALVPAGHWQCARPAPEHGAGDDDGAVLVSCVVSPGFEFADFALASGAG